MARQSKVISGCCFSKARRTSASNGSRPILMSGGVRNQYSTRGRTLPRRFAVACTRLKLSTPRLSRENLRNATLLLLFRGRGLLRLGGVGLGFGLELGLRLGCRFRGLCLSRGFGRGFGRRLRRGF